VLIGMGKTRVLCTVSFDEDVPPWMRNSGQGWVTAEYAMLPGSGTQRVSRRSVSGGRTKEIQRLIGRSLRAAVDLSAMPPIIDHIAAVSVGLSEGRALLDLDYEEDVSVDVDCNIVMTGGGDIVEIQGTAERKVFSREGLDAMIDAAAAGIRDLVRMQAASRVGE
jgi:ribonuclease PH